MVSASLPVLPFYREMETGRSSETSVNLYQTAPRHIPEYSTLHSYRRENLVSHNATYVCSLKISLNKPTW
jgi:hypothetical protein